jgi:hypothetical protein
MSAEQTPAGLRGIDFLPASYHEQRAQRKLKLRHRGLLAAAAVLVLIATALQYRERSRLASTRDLLEGRATSSLEQLHGAEAKRRQIEILEAQANLVTQLRVCVPPTRLLEAVTGSLPEFVSLSEFQVKREPVSRRAARAQAARQSTDPAQQETPSPAELDLQRVIREQGDTALAVTIKGLAPDDLSVSSYLAALHRTNVFDEIQLLYTDQTKFRDVALRTFGIKLFVRRPGAHVRAQPPIDSSHSANAGSKGHPTLRMAGRRPGAPAGRCT